MFQFILETGNSLEAFLAKKHQNKEQSQFPKNLPYFYFFKTTFSIET